MGGSLDRFQRDHIDAIDAVYPRLGIKERVKDDLCGIARRMPETTYDNFVGDLGQRYVPGYSRPSAADRLKNAPYPE